MDLKTLLLANLVILGLEAGALFGFSRAYPDAPGLKQFWRAAFTLLLGAGLINTAGAEGALRHPVLLALGNGMLVLGFVFLNRGVAEYWTRPFRHFGAHLCGVAAATLIYWHYSGTHDSLLARTVIAGLAVGAELGLGAWLFLRERALPAALVMAAFAAFNLLRGPFMALARGNAVRQNLQMALVDYGFLLFGVLLAMALVWMIIGDLRVRLDQLARTDDLTGLLNRRALDQEGAARMAGAALIVLDLDHFKQLNDRYGHAAGDHALRQVAEFLRAGLGDGDIAARLGGEEFVMLLESSSLAVGVERAERLRQGIAAMRLRFERRELGLSASFGVATPAHPAETWYELLQRADAALYEAKQAGRNCVCAAPVAASAGLR